MSPSDDDLNEMSEDSFRSAARRRGSVVPLPSSDVVTQFLAELRGLAGDLPPAPSQELGAILAGAVPLRPSHRERGPWSRHRRLAVVAVASVAALSFTGVAAANDRLPQPVQRYVSNVVNVLTPFHLDPSRLAPTPHVPVPVPFTPPSPSLTAPESPEPHEAPEPSDGASAGSHATPGAGDGSSSPPDPETGGAHSDQPASISAGAHSDSAGSNSTDGTGN